MQYKTEPKILIVNPYGIGDVLFCTPLIRTLRTTYPKSYIAVLLGSRTEAILEFNPNINAIFIYNKDHYRSLPFLQKIHYLVKLLITLRKKNFDLCFDLSNSDEYGFLAKFIWGIPIRIGFNYKNRGRLLTHKIKLKSGFSEKHVAGHYNSLLQFLNIDFSKIEKKLDFYVDPSQKEWLETVWTRYHIQENDILICILPGGGASWGTQAKYRYWPFSYFGKLADTLIEHTQAKVFIIGSSSEKKLCAEVIQNMKNPVIDLSGQTTLHQLGTLMKRCHFVIGSESGPLHLSTALGCITIPIYGPVDETVYGPYTKKESQNPFYYTISCRPCYRNFSMPHCQNTLCLKELDFYPLFHKMKSILSQKESYKR